MTAHLVDIGEIGTVSLFFRGSSEASIGGDALLYEGRLYDFLGRIGKHGDRWYLASGETITGRSTKAPKRVSDPISDAVSDAVNAFIDGHPEIVAEIEANERERKIKKLKDDLKWTLARIEDKRNEERDIRQKLRDLGEDA